MIQMTFFLKWDSPLPQDGDFKFVRQMTWENDEACKLEVRRNAIRIANWISMYTSLTFLDAFKERMVELKVIHDCRPDRQQASLPISSQ